MREVDFIDVFTPMLDEHGQPRSELFVDDGLHMNASGYALWRRIIAPYLEQEHHRSR
jgi:lysophospholipase L1-like esterase